MKKDAQVAETPKPSETASKPVSEQQEQETASKPSPAPVGIQIPTQVMEKIKALGMEGYVEPILSWADGLEKRLAMHEKAMEVIAEQMPQKSAEIVVRELNKAAEERQRQTTAPAQGQPSGEGVNPLGFMKELMGSGGGAPDATTMWLADIGKEQVALSRVLYTEMIKRMVPDAMAKLAEEMAKSKGAAASG